MNGAALLADCLARYQRHRGTGERASVGWGLQVARVASQSSESSESQASQKRPAGCGSADCRNGPDTRTQSSQSNVRVEPLQ